MLTLIACPRENLSGFSPIKMPLSPPTIYKEATVGSPHIRGREWSFPSLRMEYLHTLVCLFLQTHWLILPIYIFIQLFIYITIDPCVFFTLGYNLILHYVFCSNCSGFVHWELLTQHCAFAFLFFIFILIFLLLLCLIVYLCAFKVIDSTHSKVH